MHRVIRRFLKLIEDIFNTSSIHGFPYVIRRDFHFLEKLFWLGVLSVSFFCANVAFSDQLKRYEENPTVLSVEIVSYGEFHRPTFTICASNYSSDRAPELVEKMFKISSTSDLYENYTNFMLTVKDLMYDNLQNLKPYISLDGVDNVNLMDIANEMYKDYPPTGKHYAKVMTERGMCQTSSRHYKYLLPFQTNSTLRINKTIETEEKCTSLEVCRASVTPNNQDRNASNRIYINSHDEIMSGDDLDFVELIGSSIQEKNVKIDDMIADEEIRNFKPKSRKCKFIDEGLDYPFDYKLYTPNFCKITCRIRRALRYCKCVPFFYPVRNVKFCNVTGLLCLADSDWYNANSCGCMKLCETTILTKLASKDQNLQFDRMLTVDLIFPKTRIKRSVLFDFDDLLVGLGGSLALFLGLSFLCSMELIFHIIEYFMEVLINCVKA